MVSGSSVDDPERQSKSPSYYVDGGALCRMFNKAIVRTGVPKYLSSDNGPLFIYHL